MIDYDCNGKPGERITFTLEDGLFRCWLCGLYFHIDEVREIKEIVDGYVCYKHVCRGCDAAEEGDTTVIYPKEGDTK